MFETVRVYGHSRDLSVGKLNELFKNTSLILHSYFKDSESFDTPFFYGILSGSLLKKLGNLNASDMLRQMHFADTTVLIPLLTDELIDQIAMYHVLGIPISIINSEYHRGNSQPTDPSNMKWFTKHYTLKGCSVSNYSAFTGVKKQFFVSNDLIEELSK